MPLTIRKYQPTDQSAILKLHIEGLEQYNASIVNQSLDKDMENIQESYLSDGDFLVGIIGEEVICMGAFRKKDDETAEIKRIRIDLQHQMLGYGQEILLALEHSARIRGFIRLILDTTSSQVPAQKLFLKNGYHEINRKQLNDIELIFYEKSIL